jgi:PKD repeat protein
VADARYFFDGFGMTDEAGQPVLGDRIQLDGDTKTARVVAVNYATKTLTLDQALTWTDGKGVTLAYLGQRPDVGAYEYTSGANQRPVASFTVSVRADQPMTADFDASGSSDPDGQIVRYDWDFGDGQTLANAPAKVAHTFEATGQYTVKLTVTDNGTPGLTDTATAPVNVTVASQPLRVVGVTLNQRSGRGVSAIEPSGIGVRTIEVVFNKPATFDASAIHVKAARFDAGREVLTDLPVPRLTGNHTNVMTLTFDSGSVVDTWVKVILSGDGTLRDEDGQALDGDPLRGTAGPGYIASAALDLPSGDGTSGGDAAFYVGSLRGDLTGDGEVTPEDISAFFQKYAAGDADADFRGVGFADSLPEGTITSSDIDGFLSIYEMAVASGSSLDPLPGVSYP